MHKSAATNEIPVRFSEGIVHGFLVLRSIDGTQIAQGELSQICVNGVVKSHMAFHFGNGSIFEEVVEYTQQRVFTMQRYRQVMRGATFPEDSDIALDRASGTYRVSITDRKNGKTKVIEGKIDLPGDIYNGMAFTVTKNLPEGTGDTVHYVGFTPEPKIIELELSPSNIQKVLIGKEEMSAFHYVLKPKLGALLTFFATITGQMPPDEHVWVLADEVPAFVRFRGTLFRKGPTWTIELISPRWPE